MPHRVFLPKQKKRSTILSISSLIFVNILMLLLIGSRLMTLNNHDLNVLGFATDINITQLLELTNSERQKAGLSPVTYNNVLANSASEKARDMFEDDYWAHVAPDGKTPWDFIVSQGYKYTYAGENLAKDFNKSTSVVSAWMNSPSHRANILNPNYTEVGFAVLNGNLDGEETTLVVQMFGQPVVGSSVSSGGSQNVTNPVVAVSNVETTTLNQTQPENLKNVDDNPVVITSEAISISNSNNNPEINELITVDISYVKYFSYFILLIFSFSLVVDGFIAYHRGYLRITGNTVFHILLFLFSIFFIYYLNNPQIL